MKKYLIVFLSVLLPIIAFAQFSGVSGISDFSPWRLSGTAIQPKISSWTLGSSGTPIGSGFFTNLTTSIMTISNSVTGNLTVNGGTINLGASPNTATTTIVANGSGQLTLSAAGTNQNVVLTPSGTGFTLLNGNVGIGTTGPSGIVHITTSTTSTGDTRSLLLQNSAASNVGPLMGLRASRGSIASPAVVQSGDEVGLFVSRGYDGAGWIDAGYIRFLVDTTPGTNDMPGRMDFATTADGASSASVRMTIKNDGNLGIGTTSPGRKFDIDNSLSAAGNGSARILGYQAAWEVFNRAGTANWYFGNNDADLNKLYIGRGYGPNQGVAPNLVIDQSSNVGIGTTNPSQKLSVTTGSSGTQLQFSTPGYLSTFGTEAHLASQATLSSGGTWTAQGASASILLLNGDVNSGDFRFFTNTGLTTSSTFAPTERVRINSAGNVGIGTTSPANLLHIAGGASATTTIEIGSQSTSAKTCFQIRNSAGTATRMYVNGTTLVVEAGSC